MDIITLDFDIFEIEYTSEELSRKLLDFSILQDAFLALLNPEAADDSDLPFCRETAIEAVKEIYFREDTTYSRDFLNRCFNVK